MRARTRCESCREQHGALTDNVVEGHFKCAVCLEEPEELAEPIGRGRHSVNFIQIDSLQNIGRFRPRKKIVPPDIITRNPGDVEIPRSQKNREQCAKRGPFEYV